MKSRQLKFFMFFYMFCDSLYRIKNKEPNELREILITIKPKISLA
jgi:hypothetical protein